MSWLMFVDESGHDHKNMPYEVRGGIVVHVSRVGDLIDDLHENYADLFGTELHVKAGELKGEKLLGTRRFEWASNLKPNSLTPQAKRGLAKSFTQPEKGGNPTRSEFSAYGDASIEMAKRSPLLLEKHGARVFASMVPPGSPKIDDSEELRPDLSWLFQLYGLFLEEQDEHGLIVMDETEKSHDRRFIMRLRNHAAEKKNGFSSRIVSTPLFVSSDMTEGVQMADLCLYMLNWGAFRTNEMQGNIGNGKTIRQEIANMFAGLIKPLLWEHEKGSSVFYSEPS